MTTTQTTIRRAAAAATLALATLGTGCKKGGNSAEAAQPAVISVGPENIAVVKASEIQTGPAISGTLAPEEQANLRAEVGGSIVQTYVEQGDRVSRGQPIARIDDSAVREQELSARTAVSTAQANYDVARRQYERTQSLLQAGAVAQRDLETARTQMDAANAQLANARAVAANAEKQLAKTTLRSPIDGIVSARNVSAGDVVQPGGAIATVVKPSTMRLEANVPAEQLSAVRVGAPVQFTVNGYPNRAFTGRVTRINPIADPATRQVRIIVSLPNANGSLVGGLFADGRVAAETRTAPVAPLTAVDERGVRPSVMQVKGGTVKKVDVTLGIRDPQTETVEIRGGIVPGDTVLVGSARGISPGTPVKVQRVGEPSAPAQ
jgi:RND family efflux transporter MFP subunit